MCVFTVQNFVLIINLTVLKLKFVGKKRYSVRTKLTEKMGLRYALCVCGDEILWSMIVSLIRCAHPLRRCLCQASMSALDIP